MHVQVTYLGLVEKLKDLMVDPMYELNAAVYTELSDVEAEINGLITYDRQVRMLSDGVTIRLTLSAREHLWSVSLQISRRVAADCTRGCA